MDLTESRNALLGRHEMTDASETKPSYYACLYGCASA